MLDVLPHSWTSSPSLAADMGQNLYLTYVYVIVNLREDYLLTYV